MALIDIKNCKEIYCSYLKVGEYCPEDWFGDEEYAECTHPEAPKHNFLGDNRENGFCDIPDWCPKAICKGGWIPFKYHYITEEERQREEYPEEWVYYIDCTMPDDGDEILVTTTSGYVEEDICYIDDGYSLDSGYDWIEDIIAWMPKPTPYKESK